MGRAKVEMGWFVVLTCGVLAAGMFMGHSTFLTAQEAGQDRTSSESAEVPANRPASAAPQSPAGSPNVLLQPESKSEFELSSAETAGESEETFEDGEADVTGSADDSDSQLQILRERLLSLVEDRAAGMTREALEAAIAEESRKLTELRANAEYERALRQLKELVDRYPDTAAAARARRLLQVSSFPDATDFRLLPPASVPTSSQPEVPSYADPGGLTSPRSNSEPFPDFEPQSGFEPEPRRSS